MKTLKFSLLACIMTIFLMNISLSLSAQEKRFASDNSFELRDGFIKNISNLTDEKTKSIKELLAQNKKDLEPLKKQLSEKEEALRKLVIAEKPDKPAIEKLIDEIGVLRAQIMKKNISFKMDVRGLLTDEQKKALEAKPVGPKRGKQDDRPNK